MLRKIIIGIIIVACGISLFMSYSFLKEEVKKHQDAIITIPKNAAVIVECHDIRSMWSRISETNLVWSEALGITEIQQLDSKIRTVDSLFSLSKELKEVLDKKQTVFSFHANGKGADLFMATIASATQFEAFDKMVKSEIAKIEEKTVDKHVLYSFATKGGIYHYTYSPPFILFSSSNDIIQSSLSQIKNKKSLLEMEQFEQLRATSSNSSSLHCYINFNELRRIATPFVQKEIADKWQNDELFPKWAAFDFSLKSDAFLFSGLSTTDSKNKYLNTLLSQESQQSLIKPNLPKDIKVLKRVAISNPKEFIKKNNTAYLNQIEEKCQCDPIETISSWMGSEIVFLSHSRYQSGAIQSVLVETNGAENVLSRLTSLGVGDSAIDNNHGVSIYTVNDNSLLHLFGKEFSLENDVYFCQNGNYAIFSSLKGINKILRQWRKEKAVVQQTNFSSFSERFMANFSSSDYFITLDKLIGSMEGVLKQKSFLKLNSYLSTFKKLGNVSWQTAPSGKDYQYHSLALNTKQQGEGNNSNTLWNLRLKTAVIRTPELMKNHRTNTLEVLLQDNQNAVHLISATGKIKWSKQLESAIMGKVKQIDVYGNNKWQMLFNTSSKIHLLDINGNEVKGFPIHLKAPATNSVAVIDYDKNKQYRILVACSDKKIYNYNQEGKIVEGWKCEATESLVVNELKHFISENKDYILFTDISGVIYMVDRRGASRISLTQKIKTPFQESIYFEKGFTFTTSKITYKDSNSICKIEFNDTKSCFMLDSIHENYDVTVADLDGDNLAEYIVNFLNRIEIYGPDKKLSFFETFDYNINHQVKIIGNNKKFLLIENDGEIYLYSSNFTAIPNFPASGSTLTTVGDINKDGKTNVITISESNELRVYSLEGLEAL